MIYTKIITLLILLCSYSYAQVSIVAVGDATIEKTKIAFSVSKGCDCFDISNIIRADLGMYKNKLSVFDGDLSEIEQLDHEFILSKNTDTGAFDLASRVGKSSSNILSFSSLDFQNNNRLLAHTIADHIYQDIFNIASIFKSKIYYISSDGIDNQGKKSKQLFVSDYDGAHKKQITDHDGYVFSPAISENQSHAIYSVILNKEKNKNVNLYIKDLSSGKYRILSNFKGINSGAVFSPGGEEIVLTLTHSGNAELYRMNIKSKSLFPLTRHFGSDVDPSISPDGKTVTFLSSRAGKPMIYTLDTEKTEYNIKRVSFVGDYNATPRFSPDGETIIFSSWLDNQFDLFRLNYKGMNLVRLTKDHGSNESPYFSPDGEFVIFSSQKILNDTQDVKKLYIMTKDGEILTKISPNHGKMESPVWVK
jgi:TolB protein